MINTAAFQSDWVGRVIDGKFPLLEWLGSSESGAVFRTELQESPSQRAAIRLVSAAGDGAQATLDGWKEAAALSHAHLMRLIRFGRCKVGADEVLYAVTEFAEEALSQVLPERPLTQAEAREMLAPVLDALLYVHGKGMVYGRLKPTNIMVVDDQMKLPVDTLHRAGILRSPLAEPTIYDAPEKARGMISAASDIWSLGITLVEAMTQHPPFWDRSSNSDPDVPGSVPQPFADIARKCLQREPARRCTVMEIQALLDPARSVSVKAGKIDEVVQPPPLKLSAKPVAASQSKRRVSLLIAAVLVLCIVVAAILLHKTSPSPSAGMKSEEPVTRTVPTQSPTEAPVAPNRSSMNLSAKGEVADRVMPDISAAANGSIHGKFEVKVRVSVDANGQVSNARFESHGPSRYFANQALQAARGWKFKAAQADGQPMASEWILRFEFRRDKTDCTPLEIAP